MATMQVVVMQARVLSCGCLSEYWGGKLLHGLRWSYLPPIARCDRIYYFVN